MAAATDGGENMKLSVKSEAVEEVSDLDVEDVGDVDIDSDSSTDRTPSKDIATSEYTSSGLVTLAEANDLLDAEIGKKVKVDTKKLCESIRAELKKHSIPRYSFAAVVLNRSTEMLKYILRKPKPWGELRQGKCTYRRMYNWLRLPVEQRLALISHDEKVKRTRFTVSQKQILQAAFSKTPLPSRKKKEELARRLHVDYAKIHIYFQCERQRVRRRESADGAEVHSTDEKVDKTIAEIKSDDDQGTMRSVKREMTETKKRNGKRTSGGHSVWDSSSDADLDEDGVAFSKSPESAGNSHGTIEEVRDDEKAIEEKPSKISRIERLALPNSSVVVKKEKVDFRITTRSDEAPDTNDDGEVVDVEG